MASGGANFIPSSNRSVLQSNQNNIYGHFSDLRINNHELFPTVETMRSHLPSDDIATRFVQIVSSIGSPEQYNQYSFFNQVVSFDFSRALTSQESSQISNYLSTFNDHDKCILEVVVNPNPNLFRNWQSLSNNYIKSDLIQVIVSDLENDLNNLNNANANPLSHGYKQDHDNYKTLMKNVCRNIFRTHYNDLKNQFESQLGNVSSTSLDSNCDNLLRYIELNADRARQRFNASCNEDQDDLNRDVFIPNIYTIIQNYTELSSDIVDTGFKKLFFMSFYPYFHFLYLMFNVAMNGKESNSLDAAPRFFFVQRIAVIAIYMCLYYMCMVLHDKTNSNSNASEYIKIIEFLSKINDELFSRETLLEQTDQNYGTLQQDVELTHDSSKQLQERKNMIIAMRQNLSKVAIQDVNTTPRIKRSKAFLIVWSVFFVLFFIGAIALLYMFPADRQKGSFWIFLIITTVIIIIAWIVDAVKVIRK